MMFKTSILFHLALTSSGVVLFMWIWGNRGGGVDTRPVVNSPLGQIKGYYMKTQKGKVISAFTSIPFAVPPLGHLRFKAPVPQPSWEGALDANTVTPQCVQRNPYIRQKDVVGQEDCLYLNIYTPSKDSGAKLPVMVFFHGGGWMCGDSTTSMYGPEYLLDHQVILVTMNYRLGPLGFLSTQDEHCPGNNGLKDQQEGLRFIQKVIESFGGDKDSVTLFGESAGGASVHFHMLSKTSIGLFHKAISESGTALVPWAEAPPGEGLRNAHKLAEFLDCPPTPSDKLMKCLRKKDGHTIIDTEFKFYAWDYEPMTPFKAVVEPDLPGAFLTKEAREVKDVPAVPWLNGLTSDEGCLKSVWITSNETRYKEFVTNFDTIAPVTFYYDNTRDPATITQTLKDRYLKGDDEAKKQGIMKLYTDSYFAYPAIEGVEHTFTYTHSPIYLYELAYRASNSFSQIFGDPDGDYGVCHADELMHLFPIQFLSKPVSAKDREVGRLIRTMWTNFAKTGNPNRPVSLPARWEPASSATSLEYLEIGKQLTMKRDLASRSKLWGNLPLWHKQKYHQHDYLNVDSKGRDEL